MGNVSEVQRLNNIENPRHTISMGLNGIIQGAGTYNATEILGYKILLQGSADWSITFLGGSALTIPSTAMIEGSQIAEKLVSITVPASASALIYIPTI